MELTQAQQNSVASFKRHATLVELSEAQETSELLSKKELSKTSSTKSSDSFTAGAQGTSKSQASGRIEHEEESFSSTLDWSPMLQVVNNLTAKPKPPRRPRPQSVHESMVGMHEGRRKHGKSKSASKGSKKNSDHGVERGSAAWTATVLDGSRFVSDHDVVDLQVAMTRVKELEVENRQLRKRLEQGHDWRDLQDQIARVKQLEVENSELRKQLEDATPPTGDKIARRKQSVVSNVTDSMSRSFSKRLQTRV